MKNIITLIFFSITFSAFSQSEKPIPPSETNQKVVEIDSVLYVEVVTTTYQRLSDQILNQYDQLETAMENHDRNKAQLKEDQKEYQRLLRQAIRQGYEPREKNERGQFLRIKEKMEQDEKPIKK
jgi:hypothetical protein